jgi:hypothetical protein
MPEERKLVTILFSDVTGSTSLGESLDTWYCYSGRDTINIRARPGESGKLVRPRP